MRVVIADANPARVAYIRQVMQRLGYNIVAVGNDGIWAVSFCKKHTPDLAIVDAKIPAMSADRVAAAIRRDGTAKFILVADTEPAKDGRLNNDNHTMMIKSPLTVAGITQAVGTLLSRPASGQTTPMADFGTQRVPQLPRRQLPK